MNFCKTVAKKLLQKCFAHKFSGPTVRFFRRSDRDEGGGVCRRAQTPGGPLCRGRFELHHGAQALRRKWKVTKCRRDFWSLATRGLDDRHDGEFRGSRGYCERIEKLRTFAEWGPYGQKSWAVLYLCTGMENMEIIWQ